MNWPNTGVTGLIIPPGRNIPGVKAAWARLCPGILWPRPIHTPQAKLYTHYINHDVNSVDRNRRNRNLKTSKALLKSQAHQGTSLFTSAATNQRGVSKGGSREAQVRIPE